MQHQTEFTPWQTSQPLNSRDELPTLPARQGKSEPSLQPQIMSTFKMLPYLYFSDVISKGYAKEKSPGRASLRCRLRCKL